MVYGRLKCCSQSQEPYFWFTGHHTVMEPYFWVYIPSRCLKIFPLGLQAIRLLSNCTLRFTRHHAVLESFFFKFLADTCPFLVPLVPLFWISGDISSGFQSQSGLPYLHCGGERNVYSPRSTSGATLADLLAVGMQPVLSPHTVAEVRLPGFELVLSEYL